MKWTFVPPKEKRGARPVYLLCNADESEPGTFKDRILIEQDPHQILEGMMLASFALDVKHAYIYIRGEMVHGAEILNAAIDGPTPPGSSEGRLRSGLTSTSRSTTRRGLHLRRGAALIESSRGAATRASSPPSPPSRASGTPRPSSTTSRRSAA
jgi:NADH-quinone oxidoreductase subunit F